MLFLGIFVSIIMFSIIVLLHEYGHYKTARIFKIQVDEFGLGIPPRAKKLWKNKEGTLFSLNWIPLGGFVKIAGESPEHPGAHAGENFFEKNIWQKTIVLVAGVVMNFILAWIIFFVLFLVGVKPVGINTVIQTNLPSKIIPTFEQAIDSGLIIENPGILLYPIEGSIAQKSGIQESDILIGIEKSNTQSTEITIETFEIDDIKNVQNIISQNASQEIIFRIERCNNKEACSEKEVLSRKITPSSDGKIGSYLSPNYSINENFIHKYGFLDAGKYSFTETYYQARLTLSGLGMLLQKIFAPETPREREEALDQMAGPIGIVNVVTQSLAGGIVLLCILAALISVNLGVFNLLPIPALDGGRILLLWIRTFLEYVFGKNKSIVSIENHLHVFFFLLLIALSVAIAYNDIIKILSEK